MKQLLVSFLLSLFLVTQVMAGGDDTGAVEPLDNVQQAPVSAKRVATQVGGSTKRLNMESSGTKFPSSVKEDHMFKGTVLEGPFETCEDMISKGNFICYLIIGAAAVL